ncbi:Calcium-activated chloride channel regulator 4 [Labeo rohita]|uniref:Calcium-activated chloride channel regulator 4 n=1 Tax=Labeo rohita TaxID=84645 RepID=A0ABQ8L2I3_LABRO|nr:Calcium-activated chloride channel regulator 4 [Labeo rohita]
MTFNQFLESAGITTSDWFNGTVSVDQTVGNKTSFLNRLRLGVALTLLCINAVNTAAVSPKEAGSVEQRSFYLSFPIQNGTALFFAVQSQDEQNAKSETSNIAQATKILPAPDPPGISNPMKLDGNGYVDVIITISSSIPQRESSPGQQGEGRQPRRYRLVRRAVSRGRENSKRQITRRLDKTLSTSSNLPTCVYAFYLDTYRSHKRCVLYSSPSIHNLITTCKDTRGDEQYTKQCDECGADREYINFTPNYLLNDNVIQLYGSRDGEMTYNINSCGLRTVKTGAIIQTVALGSNAAKGNGGVKCWSKNWFNGTISLDQTVGNKTSFVIIYKVSYRCKSSRGLVYTQTNMSYNGLLKPGTLNIPGNAESFTITATSHAACADVSPIIVKTCINQQMKEVSFVLLWMLLSSTSTGIKLDGNGYVDIVIAISSRVPQDDRLIDKIKDMVTEGSIYLYEALDKKVYFKEATIHYRVAKIRIDNAQGDEPYTKQYDECGAEGQYIHFTPNYLLNDTFIQLYGLRGKVFVHEWAHLRWGVYDETNDKKPFYISNRRIEATRCSKNIKGQVYEVTAGGSPQGCRIDPQTSLPTEKCKFFPNKNQNTNSSLMFLPSLDSVSTEFTCFQTFHKFMLVTIVQRKQRVVCLILDVSGSMAGPRILQQRQAATHFLRNIIEDQARVGIVTFSSSASTLSPLTTIDSDTTRENLIKLLPTLAGGWTYMCLGLSQGLKVLQKDGDVSGDELIFLTDGMATDNVAGCAPSAIQSGAIIHTLAFGNSADPALTEMANKTGGIFKIASDNMTSNQLMDVFASLTLSTGDYTSEPVQLESAGARTSDWFNGTVSVDQTVGNKTSFVLIYEISFPSIYIQSPSGLVYTQTNMSHDGSLKTVTLNIPGTAEPGDWKYSIQTTTLQSFTITATSHAARANVPPIIVKTRMNQQFSDGTKPMIVFAEVSQNYRPVINAEVWATLESENGPVKTLQLLDNGAGADAAQGDGIYSRYFTKMVNGRSSLKVNK